VATPTFSDGSYPPPGYDELMRSSGGWPTMPPPAPAAPGPYPGGPTPAPPPSYDEL